MNIIEAFQAAENGHLITNKTRKITDSFLRYEGNGLFNCFKIVDGEWLFRFHERDFTLGEIFDISWEIFIEPK